MIGTPIEEARELLASAAVALKYDYLEAEDGFDHDAWIKEAEEWLRRNRVER